MQKKNNKIKNKEHNKDKHGNKKRNTTTKKKKKKKKIKKKTRWVTLLQWTRYTKTIRDREETKGTTKKTLHVCFGVVGLQPFLVFCVFCLLQKHCFPLKTDYFVHFSVSPFLSPWLLSLFLFHSLSLSILFLDFFLFLPCFFVDFFLVFLFFFFALFLCVCFTKKYYILKVFFINYFCFLGYPVLFCLSNPFS